MTDRVGGGSVRTMALLKCTEIGCRSLTTTGKCLPCREYDESEKIRRAVEASAAFRPTPPPLSIEDRLSEIVHILRTHHDRSPTDMLTDIAHAIGARKPNVWCPR